MVNQGYLISLEGVDGCGKSTQAKLLAKQNSDWLITKNPGGTAIGQKLRSLLLDKNNSLETITELFLYMADRSEHIHKVIQPALQTGKIIICDRFIDSTVAYQGYARGYDLTTINQLNYLATGGLKPHLTIIFDLDPLVSIKRLSNLDRIEKEGLNFQQKVREGLLNLARIEPARFVIIKVDRLSIQEVALKVEKEIKKVVSLT